MSSFRDFEEDSAGIFMLKLGILALGSGMKVPSESYKETLTRLMGFVLWGFPSPEMIKVRGVLAGRGLLTNWKTTVTLPLGIAL